MWNLILLVLFAAAAVHVYSHYYLRWKRTSSNIPTFYVILGSWNLLNLLGLIPQRWQSFHKNWVWERKHEPFSSTNSNIISIMSLGRQKFFVAEPEAIAEIVSRRDDFPKPIEDYTVLDVYGRNVVTTEADEWKMHRKIVSPPFSEKNNKLVWEEAIRQSQMLMQDWQTRDQQEGGAVVDAHREMMKLALHIISAAGFGVTFDWNDSSAPWEGRTMSFYGALASLLDHLLPIILLPAMLLNLPIPYIKKSNDAYVEFGNYLKDLLEKERKNSDGQERTKENLMSVMIKNSAGQLKDSEITGNMFVFIIAGHETTAHTLMFALNRLSISPDILKKLQKEADDVCGDNLPKYEDYSKLTYTMCVIQETLRMYPPVTSIPKITRKDQTLMNGKYSFPAGSEVNLNTIGVHYNSTIWGDDVNKYNPDRWDVNHKDYRKIPSHCYLPFSEGARSCLGKKFAYVELVAVLSNIVKNYDLFVAPGWTAEKVERQLNDCDVPAITLMPRVTIPVLAKKRQQN